jgi:hypothetical protein
MWVRTPGSDDRRSATSSARASPIDRPAVSTSTGLAVATSERSISAGVRATANGLPIRSA